MDPEKVAAIKDWKPPTTLKGLQSFLGFLQFSTGRSWELTVEWCVPWSSLVRVPGDTGTDGAWGIRTGQGLSTQRRSAGALLCFQADSSRDWRQRRRAQSAAGRWKLASRSLLLQNHVPWRDEVYEIHDKEMLAVMRGLSEWRGYLVGLQTTPFIIVTDHKWHPPEYQTSSIQHKFEIYQ